jgi:hypothetical protein
MKVRLLTDGGYGLLYDEMNQIYEATKDKYGHYYVELNETTYYFYADEVEIVPDYIYFREKKAAEDKAAIKIIVVSIIATILCIAAIIYVIF